MATGGTGDLLTGVVSAWMGQLLDAELACCLGVFLHGLAGDLAAARHGEVALVAGDVGDYPGPAVLNLCDPSARDELLVLQPVGASHLGT